MNPDDLVNSDEEMPTGRLISEHQPRALASLTRAARNINSGRGGAAGANGNSFERNRYMALMELNNMLGDENAQSGFASPEEEDVVPSIIIEVKDAVAANENSSADDGARSNTLIFSDENPEPLYQRYRNTQSRRHFQRQHGPSHASTSGGAGSSANANTPAGGRFLLAEEFEQFKQESEEVDEDRVEFACSLLASLCLPERKKKE